MTSGQSTDDNPCLCIFMLTGIFFHDSSIEERRRIVGSDFSMKCNRSVGCRVSGSKK
jgi:hypothetical protein